jgi:hypothetical protein
MNNPIAIPRGIMACPICAVPAYIRFDQINCRVRCSKCDFEFEAKPYKAPVEIIRLPGGCSVTKTLFVIALLRDAQVMRAGVMERLYRTAHVYEQHNSGRGGVQLTGSIPFSEVTNLNSFNCPFCSGYGIDLCACKTWICQGAAHQTPQGKRNYCPYCGPGLFDLPVKEIDVYSERPMQSGPMQKAPAQRSNGILLTDGKPPGRGWL